MNITGTGDGFTIGTSSYQRERPYTQFGGVLNVPNEYVELCYWVPPARNQLSSKCSARRLARPTANVYGISFGQTVNNGTQNGNGPVKLGDAGSLLVIGAGGIVAATVGHRCNSTSVSAPAVERSLRPPPGRRRCR